MTDRNVPDVDVTDPDVLRQYVDGRSWYHTIDLGGGLLTPGWFDTRRFAAKLPFPERLDGMRCLDVGTFDGFWAFEMERRGATEVIAADVFDPAEWDWPPNASAAARLQLSERHEGGTGFEVARRSLGSRVKRINRSVYDLDPDNDGLFDFVYLGSLLLHLRDPVGALSRVRSVCGGDLLLVDTIDLPLTIQAPRRPLARLDGMGRPWWWTANQAGLVRMAEAAGFELVGTPRRIPIPAGEGQERSRLRLRTIRTRAGRESLLRTTYGDPHVAMTLRPSS